MEDIEILHRIQNFFNLPGKKKFRLSKDKKILFEALKHNVEALGYGVIVSSDTEKYPFGWDGKNIRIEYPESRLEEYGKSIKVEIYILAHELGHLQISHPTRRNKVDFGLGKGFISYGKFPRKYKRFASDRQRQIEEHCANLIGLAWCNKYGYPIQPEAYNIGYLNTETNLLRMVEMGEKPPKKPLLLTQAFHLCLENGILNEDFEPALVLRTK